MKNHILFLHLSANHNIMGKKKNKKKPDRRYKIPMEYVIALADRIHSTAPTMEILTNTLSDFYALAFAKGYGRNMADRKYFKQKQQAHENSDWNKFKDELEDKIHPKQQISK